MTDWPRISIVTPSYNQAQFLEQTICSVLEQKYPNLEHIIIDGGSTDDSVEIIRKYAHHLTYWVSERDRGHADALNKGFARTTGEILAYINSDDYYLPGAFRCVAEEYMRAPFQLLAGACRYVDAAGNLLSTVKGYPRTLLDFLDSRRYQTSYLTQPEVFWSRSVHERQGPFSEEFYWAFDYEYWLRAVSWGAEVRHIEEELACFRRQADQKTQGTWQGRLDEVRIIEKYLRNTSLSAHERHQAELGLRHLQAGIAYLQAHDALKQKRRRAFLAKLMVATWYSPEVTWNSVVMARWRKLAKPVTSYLAKSVLWS